MYGDDNCDDGANGQDDDDECDSDGAGESN